MVINRNTDIDKFINIALNQYFEDTTLKNLYEKLNIKYTTIDMAQRPQDKDGEIDEEIDVGSCDRWNLLYNMLQGLYTETNNSYGNFSSDKHYFMPNLYMKYDLKIDNETFEITHKWAFINTTRIRLVPIQENS